MEVQATGTGRIPHGVTMRRVFKRLAGFVLIPLTKWFLSKERTYKKAGLHLRVFPGVFHPGLFSSTTLLLEFLEEQGLKGSTFLELGCGTGLLSIAAARKGASVTASDMNPKAIENTRVNAEANGVHLDIVTSDLFTNLPPTLFDWIIINPPYYAKNPTTDADVAWYCGENFEYFEKLFKQLIPYRDSNIIMVLTQACDVRRIKAIAMKNGFQFETIREKESFFDERDFLFRVRGGS
ncbi:MAG TPA: methyltransferase [Cyclobacteriaceae bacterium]